MFTKAIVSEPAPSFAEGLTTAGLGVPDYELALRQHQGYCVALEKCGLELIRVEPDADCPDGTFVEDTAVLTSRCAVIARPGAPSRRREVSTIRNALAGFYPELPAIHSPGTVDGGDICEAGQHFFIGLSARTNQAGAEQLAALLTVQVYTYTFVDIRAIDGLLHLKSGLAYLGDNRLAISPALLEGGDFSNYEFVLVEAEEEYAANCVRINDHVLLAAGYPVFAGKLQELGYQTIALEMSEFRKMDGGLSCLSLRF
jgi:dimethylargininase